MVRIIDKRLTGEVCMVSMSGHRLACAAVFSALFVACIGHIRGRHSPRLASPAAARSIPSRSMPAWRGSRPTSAAASGCRPGIDGGFGDGLRLGDDQHRSDREVSAGHDRMVADPGRRAGDRDREVHRRVRRSGRANCTPAAATCLAFSTTTDSSRSSASAAAASCRS